MDEREWLAERFEANRAHLRAVAHRMLGSLNEADDAVQEAWLRLSRSDVDGIDNLGGWLTTTVGRVCLDMLRSRRSRREELLDGQAPAPIADDREGADPEQQALLADSIGLALLVVLQTLDPAERLAFVLHDMFAVPFDEIAPIVDRSPAAARQLASRARRRVQGAHRQPDPDLARQREVVEAFLAATRGGDLDALVAVLDPDVVARSNGVVLARGATAFAKQAILFAQLSLPAEPALVNGMIAAVGALPGERFRILTYTIEQGRITAIDVINDPEQLDQCEVLLLDDGPAGQVGSAAPTGR